MEKGGSFVPALGIGALTPLYQFVVDVFCRDDHVKRVVLDMVEGERMEILDLACGTGKMVDLLARQQSCCRVSGMDIDPEMVRRAQERNSEHSNVTIVAGDATDPPFPDASFDIVLQSLMFHHLSDEQKRLATSSVHRILRQGGIFLFVDWSKPATVLAKGGFEVVKLLDGKVNTASHASDAVFDIIQERFVQLGDAVHVNTTVGTISVVKYTPR